MTAKTLAPVAFARTHINNLRLAGASVHRIAKAADVTPGFINGIVYGDGNYPRQHADADSVKRVLALELKDIPKAAGGQYAPLQPAAQRRARALYALGFPFTFIAKTAGYEQKTIAKLVRDGQCQTRIAQAVTTVYEQLRDADPADHGIPPHVIRKCRETATENGWHTADWWDGHGGIDSDATPVHTRTLTAVPEQPAKGWQKAAACRGEDPELFYPASYTSGPGLLQAEQAKAVCSRCPVRALCLADTIRREHDGAYPDGIYGGTTPAERWNTNTQEVAA